MALISPALCLLLLQVLDLEALANDKYKVRLTDGKDVIPGVLASQVSLPME